MIQEGNHGFIQFQGPFTLEKDSTKQSFVIFEDNTRYLKRVYIQYLDGVNNNNLSKVKFELGQKNKTDLISFYVGQKNEVLLKDVEIIKIVISSDNNDLEEVTQTILIDAILEE